MNHKCDFCNITVLQKEAASLGKILTVIKNDWNIGGFDVFIHDDDIQPPIFQFIRPGSKLWVDNHRCLLLTNPIQCQCKPTESLIEGG